MVSINQHPWVQKFSREKRRDQKIFGPDVTKKHIDNWHDARISAAKELARKYGSGHDMAHHGEGKKHGEK